MADTIFGSVAEGYKAADEMINVEEQSKARTSILSNAAETSRMNLAAAKKAAQDRLSYLSGKKETAAENPTLDPANLAQAVKLQDVLIKKYAQTPELQEAARAEKVSLLKQQEEAAKLQGIERESERAQMYDTLSEATTNPESALQLTTSTNPKLAHFGQLLSSQKPVLLGGRQVLFKDLSLPEQKEVISRILSPVAPKIDQGMLGRQSRLEYDYWRQQEQNELYDKKIRAAAQDSAAKREGKGQDDTAKLTIEVNKEIQAHRKNVRSLEIEQAKMREEYGIQKDINEKDDSWFFKDDRMPAAARDKYKLLGDQIDEEKQGISEQEARLEAAGAKPIPKKVEGGKYSKDSPAKPTSQKDFSSLPSGAWFINPADGKLLQKK